jgi:hypothetical protein
MASDKSRAKAFRDLAALVGPRPSKDSTSADTFYFGFVGERRAHPHDDRAEVLVSATLLEQSLETAIAHKFPGLTPENQGYLFSDPGAPLWEFDAKIRVAFALGIFGELARADLSAMRKIRNVFAHSRLKISFETPEIVEACKYITLPSRAPELTKENPSARDRYVFTAFEYCLYLTLYPEHGGKDPEDEIFRAAQKDDPRAK